MVGPRALTPCDVMVRIHLGLPLNYIKELLKMITYSLPGGGQFRVKNSNVVATFNNSTLKTINLYIKNCKEPIILSNRKDIK